VPRYVALLRAINVGGHGVVKMADLKRTFESLGLDDVVTYIQSGNVLFMCERASAKVLAARIEEALRRSCGVSATAFVLTPEELEKAAAQNPFAAEDGQRCHVTFLSAEPTAEKRKALMAMQRDDYQFVVRDRILYYAYPASLAGHRRTIDFEKVLGVTATARNVKVVDELVRLGGVR
jgi:uncharacterized protein (DUF1697 family)